MSIPRASQPFVISTTNRQITAQAGAVLIRETARAVGLGEAIGEHVHLKKRLRGFSEAQTILAMSEAIAIGASCLDDLVIARSDEVQETLRGFGVPASQTAGTFLRRFTLGHIRQFEKALHQVHRQAFAHLDTGATITLDFDSSYIKSYSSRRQGSDATYLKRYALHPLFCFVSELDVCLNAKLRRGKSHTAKGIDSFVDQSLRMAPEGVAVRARFDCGFYSDRLLAHLEKRKATYLCGVPLNSRIKGEIRHISDQAWQPCVDKEEGEVAEFGYRAASSKIFRRYVVKRIERRPGEQLDIETGGYNYWVSVTNDHLAEPAMLEREHRQKAQVEGGIRELKQNLGMHVLRKHCFYANWAWLLILVTAHNLHCWTQLMGEFAGDADLRSKRLRYRYLNVPGLLVSSGRRLSLKLRADYPLLAVFTASLAKLRLLPSPAT